MLKIAGMHAEAETTTALAIRLPRPAVGYVRVSTKAQGETGVSLSAQRKAIEAFAHRIGHPLLEILQDVASGVGTKSFSNREGLQQALEMAVREDAVMIVWDWSRLSRHRDFEKQICKHLPDRDRILCAKRGTDLRDAARDATFLHNDHFAKELSRRTKEGMDKRRAEGATFGNPNIRTEVQPKGALAWSEEAKTLHGKIADILRSLPNPRGISYRELADLLNDQGLKTLQGNEWTVSRTRNPVERARQILREEEEADLAHKTNPDFGRF